MCHQTVGLVQKICEENSLICSTISIVDEITNKINIKRFVSVSYPLGFPLGKSQEYNDQKNVVKKLLTQF